MKTKPFSELILIEIKGDVNFYEDAFGQLYQSVMKTKPFKVKDGKMSYMSLGTYKGLTIKYNNNGTHGFSIFKGKTCLEDNMWAFTDALRVRNELLGIKTEESSYMKNIGSQRSPFSIGS